MLSSKLRFLFFFITLATSSTCYSKQENLALSRYEYNPLVPIDVWTKLEPYFLPTHLSVKKKLDKIFHKERVTETLITFERAGFTKHKIRQGLTSITVGRHPSLKGYLVKVIFDSQPQVCEWRNWLNRIRGALKVNAYIHRQGFTKFFNAPKKWIYPLPLEPAPIKEVHRKHFILVVEDMDIVPTEENFKLFKTAITAKHLDILYEIITKFGLSDSFNPNNIPFNQKRQICFVDLEHHGEARLEPSRLLPYLSEPMQQHWKKLMEGGVNP